VEVLDALLDADTDIDAPGSVIAGGTPLDDATAFAQWKAARRLVERGARVNLFAAASLGLLDNSPRWSGISRRATRIRSATCFGAPSTAVSSALRNICSTMAPC